MVNLRKLLTRHNGPKAYTSLICETGWPSPHHVYPADWSTFLSSGGDYIPGASHFKEYLRSKLAGKLLIDLGCGNTPDDCWHSMAAIARYFHAATYIGIDFCLRRTQECDLFRNLATPDEKRAFSPMEIILIKGDIIDFVSRLPDDAANYAANGLNVFFLHKIEEYSCALAGELRRTTLLGGIVFGEESRVFQVLEDDAAFQQVTVSPVLHPMQGYPPSDSWYVPEVFEKIASSYK